MALTASEIESMTGRAPNANDQNTAFPVQRKRKGRKRHHNKYYHWLESHKNALMIVAAFVATLTFRVGVNPPGGFWKDTKENTKNPHTAGNPIMADKHPETYSILLAVNTSGFLASLSTILLLMSGLPLRRRFFMWILMVMMLIAITSIALTYGLVMTFFTPSHKVL